MAKIDLYINSVARFGAQGAVLSSGGNVTLRFAAGDRFASQTTSHADLVAMVEEICPKAQWPSVKAGPKNKFTYAFNGKAYAVRVEVQSATQWRVAVEPGEAGPPTVAPSGPAQAAAMSSSVSGIQTPVPRSEASVVGTRAPSQPAAPATEGLEIERHTYEETTAAAGGGPAAAKKKAVPSVVTAPTPVAAVSEAPPGSTAATGGAPTQIEKLLIQMKEMGSSDLHLGVGNPPMVRLHGEMQPIQGWPAFTDLLKSLLYEITPPKNKKEFEERNDTDFAHSIPGVSRFRANLFRDRNGIGAVFRAIPFKILTPEQLGLPKGVLELCHLSKGLVVVTGPTGSGKSTTLAALIDYINRTRTDHLITIEDPIEFVHENKKCLVNQREVHTHTRSFKDALRAALREDPDIVLVGEMRDLETIAIAVETAETGHLVFGTLHTSTAPSTVDRIIDQFPADRQEQIRQMLAESLKGVIAQTLCKKIGGGRVAAYEILMGNHAVTNLIREKKTFQLFSLMQTGKAAGMMTLNDSLLDLVKRGLVEPMEAYVKAVNKSELKTALGREGHKLTIEG